jgi:hypothetical protein
MLATIILELIMGVVLMVKKVKPMAMEAEVALMAKAKILVVAIITMALAIAKPLVKAEELLKVKAMVIKLVMPMAKATAKVMVALMAKVKLWVMEAISQA